MHVEERQGKSNHKRLYSVLGHLTVTVEDARNITSTRTVSEVISRKHFLPPGNSMGSANHKYAIRCTGVNKQCEENGESSVVVVKISGLKLCSHLPATI